MIFKGARVGKRFSTHLTPGRTLSGVDLLVDFQGKFQSKTFTTLVAAVWFLCCVQTYAVSVQTTFQSKSLTTLITPVWPLTGVTSFVLLQMGRLSES